MGADNFETFSAGKDAQEAFRTAVDDAAYEYGHGGYTGTIAEKRNFEVFTIPEGVTIRQLIRWLEMSYNGVSDEVPTEHHKLVMRVAPVYNNKWGPAVCFEVLGDLAEEFRVRRNLDAETRIFLFTGYASS